MNVLSIDFLMRQQRSLLPRIFAYGVIFFHLIKKPLFPQETGNIEAS